MAQLKLNLSDVDADAIRRLARERGMHISAFVRDAILGAQEVELAPESIERLDDFGARLDAIEARLEGFVRAADALRNRVSGLEGGLDLEPIDRRLSRLEALAERAG